MFKKFKLPNIANEARAFLKDEELEKIKQQSLQELPLLEQASRVVIEDINDDRLNQCILNSLQMESEEQKLLEIFQDKQHNIMFLKLQQFLDETINDGEFLKQNIVKPENSRIILAKCIIVTVWLDANTTIFTEEKAELMQFYEKCVKENQRFCVITEHFIKNTHEFSSCKQTINLLNYLVTLFNLIFDLLPKYEQIISLQELKNHFSNLKTKFDMWDRFITGDSMLNQNQMNHIGKMPEGFEPADTPNFPHSFLHAFDAAVIQYPNKIAIVSKDSQLTFRELDIVVKILAKKLKTKFQNQANIQIGVYQSHSILLVISLLAIWRANYTYVPLSQDRNIPMEDLLQVIHETQVKLVLTDIASRHQYILGHLQNEISIEEISLQTLQEMSKNSDFDHEFIFPYPDPHDFAYRIYSSGSTGNRKGIPITHRGLYAAMKGLQDITNLNQDSRICLYTDIAFDPFIMEVMMALGYQTENQLGGGSLYVLPADDRWNLSKLKEFYQNHDITIMMFTPRILERLAQHFETELRGDGFKKLKYVISMGEKLPESLLKTWKSIRPDIIFINGYGPTEATIATSVGQLRDKVHAGITLKGLNTFVLNPDVTDFNQCLTTPTPNENQEVSGELFISGKGVSPGYCGKHLKEENEKRFIQRVLVHDIKQNKKICYENVYRTRDYVTIDKDDNIIPVRRLDRRVKVASQWLDVPQIEKMIEDAIADLRETTFQSLQVEYVFVGHYKNTYLVAVIKITHLKNIRKDIFQSELFNKIKNIIKIDREIPKGWLIIDNSISETLKSVNAKTDMQSFIDQPETFEQFIWNTNIKLPDLTYSQITLPNEKKLAQLWRDILRNEIPNINEIPLYRESNFFHLGGSSILYMSLLLKMNLPSLEEAYLYYPTLAAMANFSNPELLKGLLIPLSTKTQTISKTPVFLIPSMTGDGKLDYRDFPDYWGNQSPIYTFKHPRFIDEHSPFVSVEQMAHQYLLALKNEMEEKSYTNCIIIGYSSGGAVAYDLAIQLSGEANPTPFKLILVDSVAPHFLRNMSPANHKSYLLHLAFATRIQTFAELTPENYDYENINDLSPHAQLEKIFNTVMENKNSQRLKIMKSNALEVMHYRPRKYIPDVTLITAETTCKNLKSSNLGWPSTNAIMIKSINHFDIIKELRSTNTLKNLYRDLIFKLRNDDFICLLKKAYSNSIRVDHKNYRFFANTFPQVYSLSDEHQNTIAIPKLNEAKRYRKIIMGYHRYGMKRFLKYISYRWLTGGVRDDSAFDCLLYLDLKKIKNLTVTPNIRLADVVNECILKEGYHQNENPVDLENVNQYLLANAKRTLILISGIHHITHHQTLLNFFYQLLKNDQFNILLSSLAHESILKRFYTLKEESPIDIHFLKSPIDLDNIALGLLMYHNININLENESSLFKYKLIKYIESKSVDIKNNASISKALEFIYTRYLLEDNEFDIKKLLHTLAAHSIKNNFEFNREKLATLLDAPSSLEECTQRIIDSGFIQGSKYNDTKLCYTHYKFSSHSLGYFLVGEFIRHELQKRNLFLNSVLVDLIIGHYPNPIFLANEEAHLAYLKFFISNRKKDFLPWCDAHDTCHCCTYLHIAVQYKQISVIEYLLSLRFSATTPNKMGVQPIQIARDDNDLTLIELLEKNDSNLHFRRI